MQPDLENLKKRISESRDLVDRIITKMPGYSGYVEKGEMNEADRVVRGFIAERFLQYKRIVEAVTREYSGQGNMTLLVDLDSLNSVLEKLYKKCAYADYGKTGAMSHVTVSQADSDKILEFDWRMIAKADELEPEMVKFEGAAPEELEAEIKRVRKLLDEFEKSFDQRNNVLLEVI